MEKGEQEAQTLKHAISKSSQLEHDRTRDKQEAVDMLAFLFWALVLL